MINFFAFTALLALGPNIVVGPVPPAPTASASTAPDPSKLNGICNDVYLRTVDNGDPAIWAYAYERKIYEAAGVDFTVDTAPSARAKIQTLFSVRPSVLQCDAMNFSVPRGHILKYAIEMRTYELINSAVSKWKIGLDAIDSFDKSTLLDFVELKISQAEGTRNYWTLLTYWSLLRKNGAKRCGELEAARDCVPETPWRQAARGRAEAFHSLTPREQVARMMSGDAQ